jgi:hypothetical protein
MKTARLDDTRLANLNDVTVLLANGGSATGWIWIFMAIPDSALP